MGGSCDVSRPVPREHAVVLACIKDKPGGGANAPSLSAFVMLRCQFGASPDHGRSLPM